MGGTLAERRGQGDGGWQEGGGRRTSSQMLMLSTLPSLSLRLKERTSSLRVTRTFTVKGREE